MLRNRHRQPTDHDFYETPAWVVHALIDQWPIPNAGPNWLEPAAGSGGIIRAVNQRFDHIRWLAIERDPIHHDALRQAVGSSGDILEADTLSQETLRRLKLLAPFDVAILNPPWHSSEKFVLNLRPLATFLILLEKLPFVCSSRRSRWIRDDMPDVFLLPSRVSFTGDGRSPGVDCAWFVWGPDRKSTGSIQHLPHYDLRRRKADQVTRYHDIDTPLLRGL